MAGGSNEAQTQHEGECGAEDEEGGEAGVAEELQEERTIRAHGVDEAEGLQVGVGLEEPEICRVGDDWALHPGVFEVVVEQKAPARVPQGEKSAGKYLPQYAEASGLPGVKEKHQAAEREGDHVGEERQHKQEAHDALAPPVCPRFACHAQEKRCAEHDPAETELEVHEAVPEIDVEIRHGGNDEPEQRRRFGGSHHVPGDEEGREHLEAEPELGGKLPWKKKVEEPNARGGGTVRHGVQLQRVGGVGKMLEMTLKEDALVGPGGEVGEAGRGGMGEEDHGIGAEEGCGTSHWNGRGSMCA